MKNFSILIPCYNCEKIIEKNNKKLIDKVQKKKLILKLYISMMEVLIIHTVN